MISIVDPAWEEENRKAELAFKKRELRREIRSLGVKLKHVDEQLAAKGLKRAQAWGEPEAPAQQQKLRLCVVCVGHSFPRPRDR